jgi:hypothetical protein
VKDHEMNPTQMLALAESLAPGRELTEYELVQLRDVVMFRLAVTLMPRTIARYTESGLMQTYEGGLSVRDDNAGLMQKMMRELVYSAAYAPDPMRLMNGVRWVEHFVAELAPGGLPSYAPCPPLRDLLCWAVARELDRSAKPEALGRHRLESLRTGHLAAARVLPLYRKTGAR